jgi:hypothetical protein
VNNVRPAGGKGGHGGYGPHGDRDGDGPLGQLQGSGTATPSGAALQSGSFNA